MVVHSKTFIHFFYRSLWKHKSNLSSGKYNIFISEYILHLRRIRASYLRRYFSRDCKKGELEFMLKYFFSLESLFLCAIINHFASYPAYIASIGVPRFWVQNEGSVFIHSSQMSRQRLYFRSQWYWKLCRRDNINH